MIENAFRKRGAGLGRWYIRGPFFGLLSIAGLLYICAMLLSHEILPATLMGDCTLASIFAGTAVGGTIAAKLKREGVLVAGLLTGAIILAMIALAVILRPTGKLLSDETLKSGICTIGGGAFGGVLCLQRPGVKKHKRNFSNQRK